MKYIFLSVYLKIMKLFQIKNSRNRLQLRTTVCLQNILVCVLFFVAAVIQWYITSIVLEYSNRNSNVKTLKLTLIATGEPLIITTQTEGPFKIVVPVLSRTQQRADSSRTIRTASRPTRVQTTTESLELLYENNAVHTWLKQHVTNRGSCNIIYLSYQRKILNCMEGGGGGAC